MNTSYKIVLLGAFVLFVAVIGYYVIFTDDQETQDPDGVIAQAPADAKKSVDKPASKPPRTGQQPPIRTILPRNTDTTVTDTGAQVTITTQDDDDPAIVFPPPGGGTTTTTGDTTTGAGTGGTTTTADTGTGDRPGPPGTDPGVTGVTGDTTTTTTEGGTSTADTGSGDGTTTTADTGAGSDTGTTTADNGSDTTTTTTVPRTHTIAAGELLSTIAVKYYGKAAAWIDIAEANPNIDPDRIKVGQVINLPDLNNDIAAQPEDEPAPAPNGVRTHTVKPGELLSTIAVKYYGKESAWVDISQANPSVDPNRMKVGQVLVLPELNDGDGDGDEPDEVRPPVPNGEGSYTVQAGDNLSKIAERFYGDTEAWDLIYARNRDKIGERPDNLKVGMVLIIPQAYSGAE